MTRTCCGVYHDPLPSSCPAMASSAVADELSSLLTTLLPVVVEHVRGATAHGDTIAPTIGPAQTPAELTELLAPVSPSTGLGVEGVVREFKLILANSVNTWHPGFLDKLYALTNPVGVALELLLAVLNTNVHVYTVLPALLVVETHVAQAYARVFGMHGAHAGGLTFPGGLYANLTALHMARVLHDQTVRTGGNQGRYCIVCSEHAHYSVEQAAILMGLGKEGVVRVAVDAAGSMDLADLERKVVGAVAAGLEPIAVVATAGTTVYGAFDNLAGVRACCTKHRIWMHVDGLWGGNMVWSAAHQHKLAGAELADLVTLNPHKMLGVPTTCLFLLVPDRRVLPALNSLLAGYLFHGEDYDLADGTLACGRRGDSVKMYLAWVCYGNAGFAARVDQAYASAVHLADLVRGKSTFLLVGPYPPPCLQVCFYHQPDGEFGAAERNLATTRRIAKQLHALGKFLVDYAVGPHGEFFRVVVNSPFVDRQVVSQLVAAIEHAGASVQA